MGKKYFAWSFDDGLEQDKKIIEILREYGRVPPSISTPACTGTGPGKGASAIWA